MSILRYLCQFHAMPKGLTNLQQLLRTWVRHPPPFNNVKNLPFLSYHDYRDYNLDDGDDDEDDDDDDGEEDDDREEDDNDTWRHATPSAFVSR